MDSFKQMIFKRKHFDSLSASYYHIYLPPCEKHVSTIQYSLSVYLRQTAAD